MRTRSDDLAILIAVVDSGGFSAAAVSLGLQVAKVSRAVSRIEQQLGMPLLNRTTRQVQVTEEGRRFVEIARQSLAQIELAEGLLGEGQHKPMGRLRVDAASPFVLHQLVPLIDGFQSEFPDIQLELSSNEGYVDLLAQRCDIAIRVGALQDSTLYARKLGDSPLHIVASPDYLSCHSEPQTPEDLSKHRTIGFSDAPNLNQWPLIGAKPIVPSIGCTNGEVIRQLTLRGNGLACLSGFMVNQDMREGLLVPVLSEHRLANTQREQVNAVYYRASAASLRIQAFLDYIVPLLKL
ncbi:LysR family transcriptional regulator [Paraferrimonas sedimenticola]|uniref:LysR family transcriptional regulator n=1 Tax=Paraferrimonas sedimenticola TaxID=375674 RepID=A0AA37RYD9_9GAMM|nr:LysR family transcriptional regulator [Paraferrimonas sedimenticola]GLP97650.1 LysR family transcriptional regulator [Paraferrimonas sedimenticola]